VSVFLSPGDDGLFGGWAIKREEGPAASEQKRSTAGQQAGQPGAAFDIERFLRAVHMRDAARLIMPQLQDTPRHRDAPVIAVYDKRAGWGLWMIQSRSSDVAVGRSMEIRCDLMTGVTTVVIK
jgi:hypothetical protein